MLNNQTLIADAYLDAYRHARHDDALLKKIEDIMRDPFDGLKLIEAMLSSATNDAELAYIAAGPLEDLFLQYCELLVDHLDALLRTDIKMRKALTGIWVKEGKARSILDKLLDKYHLQYGTL